MTNTSGTFLTTLQDFWEPYLTWTVPSSVEYTLFNPEEKSYETVDNPIVLGVPP